MKEIQTVGVLGGGLMGSGIAQVCAQAGYTTIVREVSDALGERARASIVKSFDRAIERGKASADDKTSALPRRCFTTELDGVA
ncbi:MAG: 3-hydroxyacyl-CoA dehydrogenase NAD-binding domain-containing protein, partial [Gemmatimonadaceae bacterium]